MKKLFLVSLIAVLAIVTANSQTKYTIKKLNTPYIHSENLTGATDTFYVDYKIDFDQNVDFSVQAYGTLYGSGDSILSPIRYESSNIYESGAFVTGYFTNDTITTTSAKERNVTSTAFPDQWFRIVVKNSVADTSTIKIGINVRSDQ